MDRLLADLQADLQTTIYAAFEDNKNVLLGQTARAVLSDALFERIRNDVERLKITLDWVSAEGFNIENRAVFTTLEKSRKFSKKNSWLFRKLLVLYQGSREERENKKSCFPDCRKIGRELKNLRYNIRNGKMAELV